MKDKTVISKIKLTAFFIFFNVVTATASFINTNCAQYAPLVLGKENWFLPGKSRENRFNNQKLKLHGATILLRKGKQ